MHRNVSTLAATEPPTEREVLLPQPIAWLPSLTTGNARIDHEHRVLIQQCNALLALVADGAGPAEFASALDRLASGMTRHFETEEAILAATGFARLDAHKREHGQAASQVRQIQDRVAGSGTLADRAAIVRDVRDLLIDVFLHHDLDYKSHLVFSRGRRAPDLPSGDEIPNSAPATDSKPGDGGSR